MDKLINRFFTLNIWVKIIFVFCLFGAGVSTMLVGRDLSSGGILLRLHLGFWLLYAAQVVFILLKERYVWVLTALQGVLALWTNADFTFVPLLRVLGQLYVILGPEPTVEMLTVYKYVFTSAAFTLQMLSAYALFSLLPKPDLRKKASAAGAGPEAAAK